MHLRIAPSALYKYRERIPWGAAPGSKWYAPLALEGMCQSQVLLPGPEMVCACGAGSMCQLQVSVAPTAQCIYSLLTHTFGSRLQRSIKMGSLYPGALPQARNGTRLWRWRNAPIAGSV